MRNIKYIVIHCSATKEGRPVTVGDITKWHKARGYRTIGYHYVVYIDGSVHVGRSESEVGAHVQSHNSDSIGVCYVGGLDAAGKSKDTRTVVQKVALRSLIGRLKNKYPSAKIVGHRDLSPDRNGNGKVEKWEWLKDCPCFDVKDEL